MIKELEIFLRHKSRLAKTIIILRSLYYFLNLSTIFSTLFIGIITTVFIAGTSTAYPMGVENPYKTYLNQNSNFVVLTYILNAVVAFISGVLSFFVINTRYLNAKTAYRKLNLEYLLYSSGELHYENLTRQEKNYRLYRRALIILKYEKYPTDDVCSENIE